MTIPADFNTARMVIKFALLECGKLQRGDEPSSEDYAFYMNKLSGMAFQWQIDGIKLWLQQDLAVTLTAGTALYQLGPGGSFITTKPMRINIGAYYIDTSANKRPLIPLSYDEYIRLSNVVQQGQINSYFVDKQQTNLNVFFWLTPDATAATGTAHVIIQNQVSQPTMLTDTMNFPSEWFQALYWGLADQASTGMPESVIQRCATNAQMYKTTLDNWDVEDASTKFEPDQRSFTYIGQFR